MAHVDTFTLKDGRKVTVDFLNIKSILSVKKKDMKEIHAQLKEWLAICCSKMTEEEVYAMYNPQHSKPISYRDYILKK